MKIDINTEKIKKEIQETAIVKRMKSKNVQYRTAFLELWLTKHLDIFDSWGKDKERNLTLVCECLDRLVDDLLKEAE